MTNRMPITTTDALDGRHELIVDGFRDPRNRGRDHRYYDFMIFKFNYSIISQGRYMGRKTGMSKEKGKGHPGSMTISNGVSTNTLTLAFA